MKLGAVSNSRLVYSSSDGDQRRVADDKAAAAARGRQPQSDGIIRVFREKGGRRGKTVTVVRGLTAADLPGTATELKRACGSGGTVKDGALELQGDHREQVAARLESLGYVVKLAGLNAERVAAAPAQRTDRRSTTKTSGSWGAITPPAPRAP